MKIEYKYYFISSKGLPSFVDKYADLKPDGRVEIRMNPLSEWRQGIWKKDTFRFWEFLLSNKRYDLSPWYAHVSYTAEPAHFKRNQFAQAALYALETSSYFGIEENGIIECGCHICGNGKKITSTAIVDERNVVSWQTGFSSTGRLVLSARRYSELLAHKLTGFSSVPVQSKHPNDYIVQLWCGSIEKNRELINKYKSLPHSINFQEWGDMSICTIKPELYSSDAFSGFDKYFKKLDEEEEIDYQLLPPAIKIRDMAASRWVALEVHGKAGKETTFSKYNKSAQCPKCNSGGWCPEGKLFLDYSQWDGSDICVTETGRVCVSKKAYALFFETWNEDVEPIERNL